MSENGKTSDFIFCQYVLSKEKWEIFLTLGSLWLSTVMANSHQQDWTLSKAHSGTIVFTHQSSCCRPALPVSRHLTGWPRKRAPLPHWE